MSLITVPDCEDGLPPLVCAGGCGRYICNIRDWWEHSKVCKRERRERGEL